MAEKVNHRKKVLVPAAESPPGILDTVRKNKFTIFVLTILASVLLSEFAGYEGAIGVFFVFAAVMLMVIYIKLEFYRDDHELPDLNEFVFAVAVLAFSFLAVPLKTLLSGGENTGFGVTNYAIFLAGILFLFYGYRKIKYTYPVLALLVSLSILNILFYSENTGLYAAAANILAKPEADALAGLLSSVGIESWTAVAGSGQGALLYLQTPKGTSQMWIAGGCTGVMGMGTFAALSSALVLNFRTRWWLKPLIVVVGTVGAFFVNMLRLLTLALLLYYYDMPTMLWWHKNEYFALGDLYQMIYMCFFWLMAFKYMIPGEKHEKGSERGKIEGLSGKDKKGT
ncbi:MAG: exosortase/archaeosortase family protein [Thermoplasmata archaeon]|nr:exosortase/archaeosortase family protein [Thermoplasmata archaeon]